MFILAKRFLLSAIFATAALSLAAEEFKVPVMSGPVVDEAGMLRESTRERLADFLRGIYQTSGTQLEVATVSSLAGLSIEEASIKIVDQWKLGRKKEDRGVLLLFAPQERKVRIEVGRGLEGDLPDAIANRIIREVIVPRLRDGTADRAAVDGAMAILHYTDPNLIESGHEVGSAHGKPAGHLMIWFFWGFFLLFVLLPMFSRRWRYIVGSAGIGGYWGGSGGFGGGGWGSGGGGWSGGGGGFSGGGSSGSW